MWTELLPLWMFVALTVVLMAGYPVAFTLGGIALAFGILGMGFRLFELLPLRIWGAMTSQVLLAVPLFVFMGVMLERSGLATGTIAASGTLGQIIPPSIVLVLVGDIVGVSVGDLFVAALIPGFALVGLYVLYIAVMAYIRPRMAPAIPTAELSQISRSQFAARVSRALIPPAFLMAAVLGSIFFGI